MNKCTICMSQLVSKATISVLSNMKNSSGPRMYAITDNEERCGKTNLNWRIQS